MDPLVPKYNTQFSFFEIDLLLGEDNDFRPVYPPYAGDHACAPKRFSMQAWALPGELRACFL